MLKSEWTVNQAAEPTVFRQATHLFWGETGGEKRAMRQCYAIIAMPATRCKLGPPVT